MAFVRLKVEIPTLRGQETRLLKLYDKYKSFKNNRHLKSALQKQREDEFVSTFDNLFDVSDPNALDALRRKPLVRDFLIKQKEKGRPGTMDAIWHNKEVQIFNQIKVKSAMKALSPKVLLLKVTSKK